MNSRLAAPLIALRYAIGLTATLAGLDKFFNLLADWGSYISPTAAQALPVPVGTVMGVVGVVEIAVGLMILGLAPRLGAYIAGIWLLLVSANLALAGYYDVAVRDVVMSLAAFAVARSLEVEAVAPATEMATASRTRTITA